MLKGMAIDHQDQYPRPDFRRSGLLWSSLNGQWDFLFDDDDVGLLQQWHRHGLPNQTTSGSLASDRSRNASSIVQKIAAQPERLLNDNNRTRTQGETHTKQKINVPFVFQTAASGIDNHEAHEVVWYERDVTDIRGEASKSKTNRLLLRFGAVDYEATIWVDGVNVGFHRGGHVPFDCDIADTIEGKASARLTVRVRDSPYDLTQPRGKQYWGAKPESIYYTPSTGIWQSVWLEAMPSVRLADSSHGTVLRSDDIQSGVLHAEVALMGRRSGQECIVSMEVRMEGVTVNKSKRCSVPRDHRSVKVDLDLRMAKDIISGELTQAHPLEDPTCWRNGLALWSPEHPLLYDVFLQLYDDEDNLLDEVSTTVGMRSIDVTKGDGTFRLNDRPYFQALVLDQGYWPDTGMTPRDQLTLKKDIELSKSMGFNGCRKHQKLEDPAFLYWADKLGYLVWSEMASAFEFSRDYVDRFDQEWMEAVKRDINHPCIVAWTPLNETWGYPSLKDDIEQQNHVRSLYFRTKTLDSTRPINDNCGWEHVVMDLTTFHDYSDGQALTEVCQTLDAILKPKAGHDMFVGGCKHTKGAPVICTEFGGVNIAPMEKTDSNEQDWGYTTASDPEDLLERVKRLMLGIVKGGHCCGFVYTQLTDIEQEVNGLYSFKRTPKLQPVRVKQIIEEAQTIYYGHLAQRGIVK